MDRPSQSMTVWTVCEYPARRVEFKTTRSCLLVPPMIVTTDVSGTCLNGVVDLRGDLAQFVIAVLIAPEGERQDGHVVNRARLHQRL